MAAKVARGLGKGLDSLIPSGAAPVTNKADNKNKPEANPTYYIHYQQSSKQPA